MNFLVFKATHSSLHDQYKAACAALQAIPGVGSGSLGLTPDAIKSSPEYRLARKRQKETFQALRSFNRQYVKQFAKEIKADIAARRAAQSGRN